MWEGDELDIWFLILKNIAFKWMDLKWKKEKNIKTFLFEWLLKDPTNKVIFRSNAVEKVPKVYRKNSESIKGINNQLLE